MRKITTAVLAVAALATTVSKASADYPERTVNFIVQSTAGGGSDVFARKISATLVSLGLVPSPLLIENRAGGSGVVAYNYLASKRGDPYFLGTGGGNFYTTPLLGHSPIDLNDFTPVAALARDPYVMSVKASSAVRSIEDLRDLGPVIVGSTGVATDPRFLGAILSEELGIEVRVVPFGGGGEVLAALLGEHVDVYFANPSEALSHFESGGLRAIAVTAADRLEILPEVPTFKELGHDIELSGVRGVFMPADAPREALDFWNDALRKMVESREWREGYVERYNLLPYFLNSDEFREHMHETNEFYRSMMRKVGIIQ